MTIEARLEEIDRLIRSLNQERSQLVKQLRDIRPSEAFQNAVYTQLTDILGVTPSRVISQYCIPLILDEQLHISFSSSGWLWFQYDQLEHRSVWLALSIRNSHSARIIDFGYPGVRLKRWAKTKSLRLPPANEVEIHFSTHPSFAEQHKLGYIIVKSL